MKEFIEFVTKSLITDTKSFDLQERDTEDEYKLELSLPKNEIGKIIGKHGIMADSLRTICQLYSSKIQKKQIDFKITEQNT